MLGLGVAKEKGAYSEDFCSVSRESWAGARKRGDEVDVGGYSSELTTVCCNGLEHWRAFVVVPGRMTATSHGRHKSKILDGGLIIGLTISYNSIASL